MVPAGVQLEGAVYQGGLLWVHVDRARQRVVTIADGGPPWINALLGLLPHALLDLFFQILHIVLGHGDVDVIHELVLGAVSYTHLTLPTILRV